MQKQFARLFFVAVTAVLIGAFSLSLLFSGPTPFDGAQDAQAAPPAAPTPVADYLVAGVQPTTILFQSATALAADTNTTGVEIMRFGAVDLQYVVDQTAVASEVNTTTMTIQYSNDNSNWVDGLVLANANTADGTTITRVPVFGRYMRVKQDVSNAIVLTVTLTAVGR